MPSRSRGCSILRSLFPIHPSHRDAGEEPVGFQDTKQVAVERIEPPNWTLRSFSVAIMCSNCGVHWCLPMRDGWIVRIIAGRREQPRKGAGRPCRAPDPNLCSIWSALRNHAKKKCPGGIKPPRAARLNMAGYSGFTPIPGPLLGLLADLDTWPKAPRTGLEKESAERCRRSSGVSTRMERNFWWELRLGALRSFAMVNLHQTGFASTRIIRTGFKNVKDKLERKFKFFEVS